MENGLLTAADFAERWQSGAPEDGLVVLLGSLCSVESLDERVAELDELAGHRVVFARPVFEHLEQDVALVWPELYGSRGADRKEGLPNVRRVDVLHPARQGFTCLPAEDHLTVAERDSDAVEAFRHGGEGT